MLSMFTHARRTMHNAEPFSLPMVVFGSRMRCFKQGTWDIEHSMQYASYAHVPWTI